MTEWAKILTSTVVGSVVGFASSLLLEPVKYKFSISLTSRRAERAINRELGRIYWLFAQRSGEDDLAYWAAFRSNVTDVYDYYFQHHREAIYHMKWYERYHGFYNCYQLLKELVTDKKITPSQGAEQVRKEFEFRFKSGLLNRKVVTKYAEGFQKSDDALSEFQIEEQHGSVRPPQSTHA